MINETHDQHATQAFEEKFQSDTVKHIAKTIAIDPSLNRKIVSYQGNKNVPGFRWMKYKEGFSVELVSRLLGSIDARNVLDPFSGIGTTPLVASGMGMNATGIDVMPVGNIMARVICSVANNLHAKNIIKYADGLLDYIQNGMKFSTFTHVRITRHAFPPYTEIELAKAKAFINKVRNPDIRLLLNFMCMSVLEDVSYTRKDGQFLRWDASSGRSTSNKLQKGSLPTLSDAISQKLHDVICDLPHLGKHIMGPSQTYTDSCLVQLKKFKNKAFDT